MLLENTDLKRMRLLTIGLVILILWSWEIFEHFLFPPTKAIAIIEMLPLTLLLIVLLNFLFKTVINAYQGLEKSNRQMASLQSYQASILDSSPNAIIAVDQDGLIRSFNRQAESLSGYTTKDVIGIDGLHLFKDRTSVRKAIDAANFLGKTAAIEETSLMTQSGEKIPVSLLLQRIDSKDNNGDGCVLIVDDLREKKRLERRLIVSEKLAAVSQVAAGLAHEIRNPLASISVNMRNLEDEIREGDERCKGCEKYISMISSEIVRLNCTVDNFLRAVVPNMIELSTGLCRLDEILNIALERCQQLLEAKSIYVLSDFQAVPVYVQCDRESLLQAFSNIIHNAVEAMSAPGELMIEIRQDGDMNLVKVCDTGSGIPDEDLEHIFDFYFSTKSGSLGIGLPLASLIVEQHGGRIDLESEVQKGTCVVVWLPVHKEAKTNDQRSRINNPQGQHPDHRRRESPPARSR